MIDEKYVADLEKSNEDLLVALEETETNIIELISNFNSYVMESNFPLISIECMVQQIQDNMIEETTFHGYEIKSAILIPETIEKMHKITIDVLQKIHKLKDDHVVQINKIQKITKLY